MNGMNLAHFNSVVPADLKTHLSSCCGASRWVDAMAAHVPFASEKDLVEWAGQIWYDTCGEANWLEAFTHHPKIGDVESLSKKFAATQHLAGAEQAGVQEASREVIEALAAANQAYEARFGFIFIVCATGKPALEMLRLLEDRLKNSRDEELLIAMGEQHKITLIRLRKLLSEADWSGLRPCHLTTHVLDTAAGWPAKDLTIKLQQKNKQNQWATFCQGVTNADGRIGDLLPPNRQLKPDTYKMVFETDAYFQANAIQGFYPVVEVQFRVSDARHYHIPLLLNPYGYSTYRGS